METKDLIEAAKLLTRMTDEELRALREASDCLEKMIHLELRLRGAA